MSIAPSKRYRERNDPISMFQVHPLNTTRGNFIELENHVLPKCQVVPLEGQRKRTAIILKAVRNKYHHEDEDTSMSLLTHTPDSHAQKGV